VLRALSAARITQLTRGTEVLILSQKDKWYEISINGEIGYMSADYVARQADKTGDFGYGITVEYTPLYSKPDMDFETDYTLDQGSGMKILGTEKGWFAVQIGAKKGYLPADRLVPAKPTAEMIAVYAAHSPGMVIVETAKKYLGVRYVWGGQSPRGFDCSGLVQYVYKEGLNYTFKSRTQQYKDGVKISRSELQPGDLVTFATGVRGRISHIGIYIGDGEFIHSPRPGSRVRIDSLTSGYYNIRFHSAYRVVR
jgi:uncharacterized protein YgiM (DUF1202 family)